MAHGIRVFDNGGETFDRYTVQFDIEWLDEGELLVGPTGNVPNGVCMWAEGRFADGDERQVEVSVYDVPKPVREAIKNEIRLARHIRDTYSTKGE